MTLPVEGEHVLTLDRLARRVPTKSQAMQPILSIPALLLTTALSASCGAGTVEHRPDPTDEQDDAELTKLAFDPDTVATRVGTVLKVEPFQRISGSRHGIRVRFRSGDDHFYTYLGPVRYLEREGLELKSGDKVTVAGSVLNGDGRKVIIASQVIKGDTTVTLRDEDGRPTWRQWTRWRRS